VISSALEAHDPTRPFLIDATAGAGERVLSYAACRSQVDALVRDHGDLRGARVGVRATTGASTVLWLLALDRLDARCHLIAPSTPEPATDALVDRFGLDALLPGTSDGVPVPTAGAGRGRDEGAGAGGAEVVIFTSGTTGEPKGVEHTWSSLSARVSRSAELADAQWLLAYSLSAFAGLQVFLHAVLNGGSLVLGPASPGAWVSQHPGISHLSATPTYLRLLLIGGGAEGLSPRQITLGGEPVDQPLLDRVRSQFPTAQVTHIYASSEMGTCFSVHDGRAGFPVSYLEDDRQPVWMTVRDGELHIRSPHAMRGYSGAADPRDDTGLYATGDLVEVVDDRVLFRGRRTELINVGGQKVHPREVEEVLLAEPRVRTARVWGARSSVAGQLVRADVVAVEGTDEAALRQDLLERCREQLAPFKVPRILKVVESLERNDAGKLVRR
jgi:acyl-CoA synthetase (AMP-forming)/AMP-acid ligase II